MQNTLLRIKGISKKYQNASKTIHALKGVDLEIHKGEILTLLGVNGAGKTTLSSIIATLHPPTSGDIEFQNQSIYKNLIGYRKSLAFCPQKPNFEKTLTVKENLLFAGRYFGMSQTEITKRSQELMDEFDLTQYANSSPDVLSGGYKQRLLIARSLMHNPSLVILDEPTVAIDAPIRRQLWKLIKNLRKKGVTILLTTHYFDEAEALSDRVCIVDKGEIIQTTTLENLKAQHQNKKLEDIFINVINSENSQQ